MARHDAGAPQLEQDVLEELLGDALRLREPLGGDRRAVAGSGELDERAHGVVDLCGDPHPVIVAIGEAESEC
jgi:hypothetical protein